MFSLHPQLAQDTFFVGDFPLSTCRLMNDMQFPWLILVHVYRELPSYMN